MKYLIVTLFLIFVGEQCFSQIDSIKIHQKDSLIQLDFPKGRIETMQIVNIKCANNFYVYNDFKDTLKLSSSELFDCPWSKPKLFKSIQLDSIGQEEVIIVRNYKIASERHGGTFDFSERIKLRKYEIWNLDTKVLLFEIVVRYKNKYNGFDYSHPIHNQTGNRKGKCTFRCKFKIDKDGIIHLTNSHSNSNCSNRPMPIEGKFRMNNGKYQIE